MELRVQVDPGTLDVIDFTLALVFKITLGLLLVGFDERRIARKHPDWFLRAWPPASKLSAVVLFQEIAIVIHFARTRGWRRGVPLGLLWAVAYVATVTFILMGIESLFSPPS